MGSDDDRASLVHDVLGACHIVLGYASGLLDSATTDLDRRAVAAIVASGRRLAALAAAHQALASADVPDEQADLGGVLAAAFAGVEPVVRARRAFLDVAVPPGLVVSAPRLRVGAELLASGLAGTVPTGGAVTVRARSEGAGVAVESAVTGPDGEAHRPDLADRCLGLLVALGRRHRFPVELSEVRLRWTLPAAAGPAAPGVATPSARALRVLHIEDDPSGRELVAMALDDERWDLVAVDGLPAAEAALAAGSFDVLLVDNRLGPDRGIDLLARVRRRSGRSGPRMVLTTGDHDAVVERAAIDLGAIVVRKPVDVEALCDVLAGEAPR